VVVADAFPVMKSRCDHFACQMYSATGDWLINARMTNRATRSLPMFFTLVLGLSVPFWLLGAYSRAMLMPGLSVSALMTVCPMIAALLLVYREGGTAGVMQLLRRSLDFHRITDRRWYIPILLLMPSISIGVYALTRWLKMPMPAPQVSVVPAMLMFIAFFVGALGEELGWTGYALEPMLAKWSALRAGVTLGVVGVMWHLVPLILMHRSASWIACWCMYALAARVLIVWVYKNTNESIFAVTVFHATLNLAYMLFPINGSHFDMRLGGLVTAFVALAVTVVWGPKTMTRRTC
jgi:uncharacterized protein